MKKTKLLVLCIFILSIGFSHAQTKKYKIKEGVVNYKTDMSGMKTNYNLYFEKYGKNECIEIIASSDGQKKGHIRNFNSDGKMYSVDMIKKTYTKTENPSIVVDYIKVDYETLSKTDKSITKETNETFLGKDCIVYRINRTDINCKLLYWNNILLKMVAITPQGTVSMIGESFGNTNKNAIKDVFSVPKGFKEIKIKE